MSQLAMLLRQPQLILRWIATAVVACWAVAACGTVGDEAIAAPTDRPAIGGAMCDGRAATIVGTDTDDTIFGTSGPDVIVAGGGDDTVYGLGGDDVICAGAGDDEVHGGDGRDVIDGSVGNDTLYGQGLQPAEIDTRLGSCPSADRAAVVDMAAQRFWLCEEGRSITQRLRMTTNSYIYGLPPVGTHYVFSKDAIATGIDGSTLERFVSFYRTPRNNRIGFHKYVHQDPSTIGDLDMRGASSGCLRVTVADSWTVWNHLQIGDPVRVITR